MQKLSVLINGKTYFADENQTILDVCCKNNIFIPTLCHLKNICETSNCRVCQVKLGSGKFVPACSTKLQDKMIIDTASDEVIKNVKQTIKFLLKNHNYDCPNCIKNGDCNLQSLVNYYNLSDFGKPLEKKLDSSSPCIIRDNSKCVLCGRCVNICANVQNVHALSKANRSYKTDISCGFNKNLKDSPCVGCGQCSLVCPTGAIVEKQEINEVVDALSIKDNFVVCQVAPSVRVSLAEAFGADIGTFDENKMVACLKALGFAKVFDINLGADFTTYEEANELLKRIKSGTNLPQFSSCCPAWFKYVQNNYKNYESNLSTCKSPTEMLGAIIKNYYSKACSIKKDKIVVVGIMPCTAKKGEKQRAKDVDFVLTTRELARLIKLNAIDFNGIKPQSFDSPLSEYSGGGLIYGVTGGVSESVLRYVIHKLEPNSKKVDFKTVRHSSGIKDVNITAGKTKLKMCVVSGLNNASKVMDKIVAGKKHYDFMEVMACPGGCLNGGGQIYVNYLKTDIEQVKNLRAKALYDADAKMESRQSSQNKTMMQIYNEFFIPTNGLSEKLLHYKK